jgi:hypothetical protein
MMGGRWTMDDRRWTIVHKWSDKDACRRLFFLVLSQETDNPFCCPEKMPNKEKLMVGSELFRKLLANTSYSLTDSPEGALIAKLYSSLQIDSPSGAECSLTVNNNTWTNCPHRGKTLVGNKHTRIDLPQRGYLFVENKPVDANLPQRGYLFVENKPVDAKLPHRGCLFVENMRAAANLPRRGYLFVENKPTHAKLPHRGCLFVENMRAAANLPRRGYLLNEPNISTSQKQNRHA